jgi:hypothetical protein
MEKMKKKYLEIVTKKKGKEKNVCVRNAKEN